MGGVSDKKLDVSAETLAVMRQELLRRCGEAAAKRMDDCPSPLYKYRYAKAMLGSSPMKRVAWHCIECSGYNIAEAKKCISRSCALVDERDELLDRLWAEHKEAENDDQ